MTSWDQHFMDVARLVAQRSKDPSTQVGACVVDANRRIVSTGFNGFPRGIADKYELLTEREEKYARVIHAEVNAILFSYRDLADCALYVWPLAPCPRCAVVIIQVGLKRVVAPDWDTGHERWGDQIALSAELFDEAGVEMAAA